MNKSLQGHRQLVDQGMPGQYVKEALVALGGVRLLLQGPAAGGCCPRSSALLGCPRWNGRVDTVAAPL